MSALNLASFSFDIEDWYHSQLIPARDRHDHGETVVRAGTEVILDLLDRHSVRATFFVLGEVVREHPDIVRRMVSEGHELGCHGMDHRPLWDLTPESFRAELREFRTVVEGVLGHYPVVGFRAPTFSLDRSTAWALDVLRDEGYAYDSSLFPAKVKMYGMADAPVEIYRPARDDLARHDPAGALVEFPVAIGKWAGVRMPVGGGFYLRALPFPMFVATLDRILEHRPFALYLHPRECAPEARRLWLDPVNALITYVNLHSVVDKMEKLFRRYRFVTMREVLEKGSWLGPNQRAITPRTVRTSEP
ncbi:MAG TPA: polysaccharide deacetylase family protein [Candidatus Limnocylindria bacterium]|nr:polysaccharide deacetylase family protein [Candidatus Limnocylindria bacterium]